MTAPIHPPKLSTYGLQAMTHGISSLGVYPVERAEVSPDGLHCRRAMPGHPRLTAQETWLLPELDLAVTHFTPRPGQPEHSRFYVDMGVVTRPAPHLWLLKDLYLDVIVKADGVPVLWDGNEYAQAVSAGHLTADEAMRAMLGAQAVVNGLFAHGSLEAWLEHRNVRLSWWTPLPPLHSPS